MTEHQPFIRSCASFTSLKKTRTKKDGSQTSLDTSKHYSNLFVSSFIRNLNERGVSNPQIKVANKTITKAKANNTLPNIYINDIDGIQQTISVRNNEITFNLAESLRSTLETFTGVLVELKLEFCNLQAGHLEEICKILVDHKSLANLSLNGNPIKSQPYYLVLKQSNLKCLDLQLCGIDVVGAQLIGEELANPNKQTLLMLNLAGNKLGNDGIKMIADGLRGNRCLLSLNVADNRIGSEGFKELFFVFGKFPLRHKEIVFRRKKNFEYLAREKSMERLSKRMRSSGSLGRRSILFDPNKKRRSSSLEMKSSTSITGSQKSSQFDGLDKNISKHPFVSDSEPADGDIFCAGNNTLMHLNISYNNPTTECLEQLLVVLFYQRVVFKNRKSTGLTNIKLEGNLEDSPIVTEIINFLSGKKQSIASVTNSRRASSALISKSSY